METKINIHKLKKELKKQLPELKQFNYFSWSEPNILVKINEELQSVSVKALIFTTTHKNKVNKLLKKYGLKKLKYLDTYEYESYNQNVSLVPVPQKKKYVKFDEQGYWNKRKSNRKQVIKEIKRLSKKYLSGDYEFTIKRKGAQDA